MLHITFYVFFCFCFFVMSSDFYEVWGSVMSTCLITEVKQQYVTLELGWVAASVHYSCL